jgi:hypothetical protein
MRPGYNPWATGDLYTTPPSVGTATKFEPTAALRLEGFHGNDFVGPGFVNWMLHRLYLMQLESARMRAKNLVAVDGTLAGAVNQFLSSFCYDEANDLYTILFYDIGGGVAGAYESVVQGGEIFTANNTITGVLGGITALDSDGSENGYRHVAVTGPNDIIRYSLNGGAWAAATFTGVPATSFTAIGCDRGTAGVASKFLIGDDGASGGGNALVYACTTTGVNYVNVAGFPALGAIPIRGIFHSLHPAGALYPADPGNPTWLVLTDTDACRSADGVTWNTVAHGFAGGALHRRCAAYSKTSGRWVVALQGASTGDIEYSDDDGASWTLINNAFAPATGGVQIVGDGYGTFVACPEEFGGAVAATATEFWVSVDDGMTWETVSYPVDPSGDDIVLGVAIDSSKDADEALDWSEVFVYMNNVVAGAANMTIRRSQRT